MGGKADGGLLHRQQGAPSGATVLLWLNQQFLFNIEGAICRLCASVMHRRYRLTDDEYQTEDREETRRYRSCQKHYKYFPHVVVALVISDKTLTTMYPYHPCCPCSMHGHVGCISDSR